MSTELCLRVEPILREAGAIALSHHGDVRAEWKGDGSPVTVADRAVEGFLVGALADAFPDDGIVGEEGGARPSRSGATWHVDPIDGTGAFLAGMAYWGPTVCRVDPDGRLEAGGFFVPRLGEWWWAERGRGAWRDGHRLARFTERAAAPGDVLFVSSRVHQGPRLPWPGKIRGLGSAAAHLALVASGGGSAAMVSRWKLWDVGCGVLLATETGHVVTDLDGQPLDPAGRSDGLPLLVGVPTAWKNFSDYAWREGQRGGRPPGRNG